MIRSTLSYNPPQNRFLNRTLIGEDLYSESQILALENIIMKLCCIKIKNKKNCQSNDYHSSNQDLELNESENRQ